MQKMESKEFENSIFEKAEELRKTLHRIPEASGCEVKTQAFLKEVLASRIQDIKSCDTVFSEKETGNDGEVSDRIVGHGKWFYLLHKEQGAKHFYGFRAELDAVTGPDGGVYHGCGHDGHSSVMASLALSVLGKKTGSDLVFLFQHAEETGAGALECLSMFDEVRPELMFAFHNIPGFPEGAVLERAETFACASRGLILHFYGKQSHAAYPELGNNPVYVLGKLIEKLPQITSPEKYSGMVLLTPVYVNAGAKAFGVAAGEAEICFTIRAWKDEDLNRLQQSLLAEAKKLSAEAGINMETSEQDVFAATVNDPEGLELVRTAAKQSGIKEITLPEPMRWSEDFGRFGAGCRTCMVGIGAGENGPGLHTPEYCWNPEVTRAALRLFSAVIQP